MITKLNVITLSEEDEKDRELIDWAWNSHWWVELCPGYCRCKWCEMHYTSSMTVTVDFPLCSKNPCLQKFKKKLTGK